MNQIDQNIKLLESGKLFTQQESDLFSLVLSVCQDFEVPVIARVAGGWVRDKLLGKVSDDLDIAVENTTGLTFAEHLQQKTTQNPSSSPTATAAPPKIIVIEANPDQSKHLETARVCLFQDFWIDVCGLRSETYANDSRIPQIRQGTPLEDAQRRDFTVNAIFFNINENKIEDFINGISALKEGILKTPLEPEISFGDDPLRVLRAIRFASRFNFKLDESLIPAARKISGDFRKKITKERISAELIKAFEGSDPTMVIKYLIDCKLFSPVFDPDELWKLDGLAALKRVETVMSRILVPNIKEENNTENNNCVDNNNCNNNDSNNNGNGNVSYSFVNNRVIVNDCQDKVLVLVLAAIFAPILEIGAIKDPYRQNKKAHSVEIAIARGIRMPVKVADEAYILLKGASLIVGLKGALARVTVGNWVREIGSEWKYSRYLIFDNDLFEFYTNELEKYIFENGLDQIYDMKPLLNGKELGKLHGVKPGAELRKLIIELINWQLDNPEGTVDDYVSYIKSKK